MFVVKPALELKDVTVELDWKLILADVNLKIHVGESVVFIGPSGSGKTVLLKTMAGIYQPTKGHVYVEGQEWKELNRDQRHSLASHLGMLFQKSALFDELTAIENVAFPMREHKALSEDQIAIRSYNLLRVFNLSEHRNKYPYELSGGMQQRLGIARALALNPRIVFYDDPTAGQDPIRSDKLAEKILYLKHKNNSTMVTVTSDMRRAFQLADRIFMIVDQEVIEAGTPKTILNNKDERIQQFIHGKIEGPIHYIG